MKIIGVSGTLLLLALGTSLAASLPRQLQSPARAAKHSTEQASRPSDAGVDKRKISCKTPENGTHCYWTRGRLDRYLAFDGEDGEDARWHLWKIGTRHVVRVCNGPSHFPPHSSDDCIVPDFPLNLERVYKDPRNWEPSFIDDTRLAPLSVFGDFEICPLEPENRGKMQTVCIESAKNIFVEHSE